jgi:hypothetical protein
MLKLAINISHTVLSWDDFVANGVSKPRGWDTANEIILGAERLLPCLACSEGNLSRRELARLIESWFKKVCVLQYYSSTVFESTLTVYWNGVGAAGSSVAGVLD